DTPQLGSGWRYLYSEKRVARFCGRHQMAYRTDAANPGRNRRHLSKGSTFTNLFKSAKLRDVKMSVLDFASIIQLNRNFRVPFDAGNRIDNNFFRHIKSSSETGQLSKIRRVSG